MRVCDFDGTETSLPVCPTCNEYKGLTSAEEKRTFGMISLDQAIDNAMSIMEEARDYHLDNPCNEGDCELCNEEN